MGYRLHIDIRVSIEGYRDRVSKHIGLDVERWEAIEPEDILRVEGLSESGEELGYLAQDGPYRVGYLACHRLDSRGENHNVCIGKGLLVEVGLRLEGLTNGGVVDRVLEPDLNCKPGGLANLKILPRNSL
jgi:hypothetical protein